MSWVDIAILVIVGLSCFFGLWRGLVREVLSIVAWVAAISIARVYSDSFAPMFSGLIDSPSLRYVVAFALLCVGTLILGGLLNHFISRLVTFSGLRMTDRLLGSFFGIARGVLIVTIILFFAEPFYATAPWWQQSHFIPYGIELIAWAQGFFPDPSVIS